MTGLIVAPTPTFSSLIPARRAFRTLTSTISTIRPSTARTAPPTTAAATTTSDGLLCLDRRRGVLGRLAVFVLEHDHFRAEGYTIVKVDHVLVHHPDAARRDVVADRRGFVGAMNAVE